jgi:uncharacterized protein (DUF2062 family)
MHAAVLFHPVVLAPTFNNAKTLEDVLARIDAIGLPVIAVDDGSTDDTAAILQTWSTTGANRQCVTHPKNRGKAAALQTGFSRAMGMGFTHAVTIDTDGQLDPAEIPDLLAVAMRSSEALVVGCRDADAPDYPKASRIGRYWANVGVFWASGARVGDSQCGFRVYPLKQVTALRCRAGRYGYETEVLTRAAWAGLAIEQTAVRCSYQVPEGRVTHYRPWRDSLSAARMHVWMLLLSALPWPTPRAGNAPTGTLWHRFVQWISPARAWRMVRNDPAERPRFAAALALGVFIANLPIYGVQSILSLYTARRLRLNPLAALTGSHLSTPPVGPLLIAAAIGLGHWLLYGTWPVLRHFDPRILGYRKLLRSVLLEWTLGGIVLGVMLAGTTFILARFLLRWVPPHRPADSGTHPAAQAPAPDREAAKPVV